MKTVMISSPKYGYKVELFDDEDEALFLAYNWYIYSTPRHNSFYVVTGMRKNYHRFHRLIMKAQKGEIVDHINGNALDNRRANLRITNASGNNKNATKRRNARTSKFKGVHEIKKRKVSGICWLAQIQCNKRKISLGGFLTEIEAAKAYNKAAIKLFGEFAKLNEIKE